MASNITTSRETLAYAPSLRTAVVLLTRIASSKVVSNNASVPKAAALVLPMSLPDIDLESANPYQVRALRESLQEISGVFNGATRAIGQLLAHSSVDIETGLVSQDSIESLGWLLSLMGDGCGMATVLEQRCAVVLADFEPHDDLPPEINPERSALAELET